MFFSWVFTESFLDDEQKDWVWETLKSKQQDLNDKTPVLCFSKTKHSNAGADFVDNFHESCDDKGPTVVLVKANSGDTERVVGGFAPCT